MKSIDAFQVYLMTSMRNAAGVTDGLKRLGVDASEVAEAQEMVAQASLFYETQESVCLADSYYGFLGTPLRVEPVEDSASYRTKMFYSLPVWPDLELELTFNDERFAGGIRFVHASEPKARRLKREELIPWKVVEDDLPITCREAVMVDGFSTMHDYRCALLDTGIEEYYLAFDFALLQKVIPWKDLKLEI
jgi:hypothetical protein